MAQNSTSTWQEYAAGTSDGATATHAAVINKQFFVTHISGHTDLNSLVQVKSGTTVIWESYVLAAVSHAFDFSVHLEVTPGTECSGVIAGSTGGCFVNIQGYSIP